MIARTLQNLAAAHDRRVWHALWICMLLVHLPALARGWAGLIAGEGAELRLAGFVALNLSAVLFVLKIRGVSWLRFGTDRRSLISLTVAVALLHVNIGRSSDQFVAVREAPEAVASIFLLAGLRVVGDALRKLSLHRQSSTGRPAAWRLAHADLRPAHWRRVGADAPRGPPLP